MGKHGPPLLSLIGILFFQCSCQDRDQIVVGSKNFTEQIILGELIGILIEESTDLEVVRRLNLAGTFLCHHAVQNGEIDLYVEYTGTAYTRILELPPVSNAQKVYSTVREEYSYRFDLHWTEPLGFNNTFAIMVRGEDARELNLQTISDSIQYARDWQAQWHLL